jgi:hypothetical protein
MNFKTYDHSQNYTAQVIKLPVKQPVEGLDNLVRVTVFGNDCLVGKDSPTDQLYLFFPAGAQLSEAFVRGNNLYREIQANENPLEKGFFELNRRVKAIKFRGIISTGFVIPVHSLKNIWTNGTDRDWACGVIAQLKEGDSFNELDGEEVCRKYILAPLPQSQGKGDRATRINNKLAEVLIPGQFRFHNETPHLGNNIHRLQPNDVIAITDKWHGSSCILSKVYVSKKLTLWQKFLNFLGGQIPSRQLAYIYSSGKPKSNLPKGIEGLWKNEGQDFYSANIWKRAMDAFKHAIEDGISIYGELVGYTDEGSFIQKGYDYGCSADKDRLVKSPTLPQFRFLIYRITYTKSDGNVIEFSWQQIKDYCEKYQLEHVKEIFFGTVKEYLQSNFPTFPDNSTPPINEPGQALFDSLQLYVELLRYCRHCTNAVPAEGVVLRIDGKQSFNSFKLKSKMFTKKESDDMDKGETNVEDNA